MMKIFLYEPQDFQNICTISRTLDCFGMSECYIYDTNHLIREHYGKSYSRKLRSVSAGAFEHIHFHKIHNPTDFLCQFPGRKIVTIVGEKSVSLPEFEFYETDLVTFGSESHGLPENIIQNCDVSLMIPQKGLTQSLNVSHALVIIVYESLKKYTEKIPLIH